MRTNSYLLWFSGIGADNVFIFVKIWQCSMAERSKSLGMPLSASSEFPSGTSYPDTLAGLMASTLQHAAASILVTSLTTALAFYTSYWSSITAIQCFRYFIHFFFHFIFVTFNFINSLLFSIFAGTVVMVNYVLMMTWLPATVSINERLSCYAFSCWILALTKFNTTVSSVGVYVQDRIIFIIIKMPYLWILCFGNVIFGK